MKTSKQTNKLTWVVPIIQHYLPLFFSFLVVGEILCSKGANQKCKIPKLCHLEGGYGSKKGKKKRGKTLHLCFDNPNLGLPKKF